MHLSAAQKWNENLWNKHETPCFSLFISFSASLLALIHCPTLDLHWDYYQPQGCSKQFIVEPKKHLLLLEFPFYPHFDPFYPHFNPFYPPLNPFYSHLDPFYPHQTTFGDFLKEFTWKGECFSGLTILGVVNQSSHDWKALICLSLEFQFELWFDDHDVLCAYASFHLGLARDCYQNIWLSIQTKWIGIVLKQSFESSWKNVLWRKRSRIERGKGHFQNALDINSTDRQLMHMKICTSFLSTFYTLC